MGEEKKHVAWFGIIFYYRGHVAILCGRENFHTFFYKIFQNRFSFLSAKGAHFSTLTRQPSMDSCWLQVSVAAVDSLFIQSFAQRLGRARKGCATIVV